MRPQSTILQRMWNKTKVLGECWIWHGAKNPRGYGHMGIGGRKNLRTAYVHRLAYELFHGPIPDGMYVLHTCDTPSCWRPDHLFVGTQSDNLKDAYSKGRHPGVSDACRAARWPK